MVKIRAEAESLRLKNEKVMKTHRCNISGYN